MKIASIKPSGLAVVKDAQLILLSELFPKGATMIDLIAGYNHYKASLETASGSARAVGLDTKMLNPPVLNPSKIWAAAGNYKRGTAGLDDARGRGTAAKTSPEELLENIFLKPPSALAGPGDDILIPKNADSIFPELELCVVIGKKTRHVSKEQALDAI